MKMKKWLMSIRNVQTKTYLLQEFRDADKKMYIYYNNIRNCLEFGKNKDD